MSTTRRDFLVGGLSAGAAVPLLAARASPSWLEAVGVAAAPSDNIMVVVQARGGYDWLNMLPEVDHPKYQAARSASGLRLPKSKVLTLQTGAKHFWHPGMDGPTGATIKGFKALFDAGNLAMILNIGYPKPNLSHFTSERYWHASQPGVSSVKEGWLSGYLKRGYTGSFQIPAIDLEGRMSNAFTGSRVPVFRNPAVFNFLYDGRTSWDNIAEAATLAANAAVARPTADSNLKFIAGGVTQAIADSALVQSTGSSYKPKATYPTGRLGRDLQLAARYITGGLKTQIYYISTGGFDNHANEVVLNTPELGRFNTLIRNLTGSIWAFLEDMRLHGYNKKVIVVVFSEFARRLGQNGSLGCDHGHGGGAFIAGEPVKGGLYGKWPDLSKATTPYSRYWIPFNSLSTDFRRMHATLIDRWLGGDHKKILPGVPAAGFPLLGFL